ncbi:hypothetical protein GQX74_007823 [Glossina fuscipes]|nr:hypothetical protein GQX74_007823 [Glossina fuscipes]
MNALVAFIEYCRLPKGTLWSAFVLLWTLLFINGVNSEGRIVCYYTNWSVYRPGTAKFNPQNINPYLCTHLIYAFGGFTKDNQMKPFDKYQDIEQGGYAKFTGLKTYNKQLKTMIAIGGWNEASSRFSPLVANPERRQKFIKNILKFLRQNHFDGIDLDWEYPAHREGGKPGDRDNYAQFVQELRAEFERESEKTGRQRLLLTMAVPAGIEYIEKGYDIPKLNKYLDWFNVLTYDFHSSHEPSVNHHAPLYPLEEDSEYNYDAELNIDYSIKYYLKAGADRNKLVLGIPTYGRSYTLINEESTEIGAPAEGPGEQGDATREKGYLAFYEICNNIKEDPDWEVVQPNANAMGPYAYRRTQWVGYDDEAIVRKKAQYVVEHGLGGIMFWSIDNDDFRGTCTGKPYPLIEAAKESMFDAMGLGINEVSKSSAPRKSNRSRNHENSIATRNRINVGDKLTYEERKESSRRTSNQETRKRVQHSTTRSPSSTTIRLTEAEGSSLYIGGRTTTPPPPTTPDPGTDFKCEDEGFYQHPRDCKKYYWCLDSGPSGLGIVAHQFTCPSGLYFNPAADSCDFARNVPCKTKKSTTAAPVTKSYASTSIATTTKPTASVNRITAATARTTFFRTTSTTAHTTTTTTAKPPVDDEDYMDVEEQHSEEDPKVIKELIELIRRVGGIEELEKHLLRKDDGTISFKQHSSSSSNYAESTTSSSISKSLYDKVLSRPNALNSFRNRFIPSNSYRKTEQLDREKSDEESDIANENDTHNSKSTSEYSKYSSVVRGNSRQGPQNEGLDKLPEFSGFLKERKQYVTINRNRGSQKKVERVESDEEEIAATIRSEQITDKPFSAATPSYTSIRRTRPSTIASLIEEEDFKDTTIAKPHASLSRMHTADASSEQADVNEDLALVKYKYLERARSNAEGSQTVKLIENKKNEGEDADITHQKEDQKITKYHFNRSRFLTPTITTGVTTTSTTTTEKYATKESQDSAHVASVKVNYLVDVEQTREIKEYNLESSTIIIPESTTPETLSSPAPTLRRIKILRHRRPLAGLTNNSYLPENVTSARITNTTTTANIETQNSDILSTIRQADEKLETTDIKYLTKTHNINQTETFSLNTVTPPKRFRKVIRKIIKPMNLTNRATITIKTTTETASTVKLTSTEPTIIPFSGKKQNNSRYDYNRNIKIPAYQKKSNFDVSTKETFLFDHDNYDESSDEQEENENENISDEVKDKNFQNREEEMENKEDMEIEEDLQTTNDDDDFINLELEKATHTPLMYTDELEVTENNQDTASNSESRIENKSIDFTKESPSDIPKAQLLNQHDYTGSIYDNSDKDKNSETISPTPSKLNSTVRKTVSKGVNVPNISQTDDSDKPLRRNNTQTNEREESNPFDEETITSSLKTFGTNRTKDLPNSKTNTFLVDGEILNTELKKQVKDANTEGETLPVQTLSETIRKIGEPEQLLSVKTNTYSREKTAIQSSDDSNIENETVSAKSAVENEENFDFYESNGRKLIDAQILTSPEIGLTSEIPQTTRRNLIPDTTTPRPSVRPTFRRKVIIKKPSLSVLPSSNSPTPSAAKLPTSDSTKKYTRPNAGRFVPHNANNRKSAQNYVKTDSRTPPTFNLSRLKAQDTLKIIPNEEYSRDSGDAAEEIMAKRKKVEEHEEDVSVLRPAIVKQFPFSKKSNDNSSKINKQLESIEEDDDYDDGEIEDEDDDEEDEEEDDEEEEEIEENKATENSHNYLEKSFSLSQSTADKLPITTRPGGNVPFNSRASNAPNRNESKNNYKSHSAETRAKSRSRIVNRPQGVAVPNLTIKPIALDFERTTVPVPTKPAPFVPSYTPSYEQSALESQVPNTVQNTAYEVHESYSSGQQSDGGFATTTTPKTLENTMGTNTEDKQHEYHINHDINANEIFSQDHDNYLGLTTTQPPSTTLLHVFTLSDDEQSTRPSNSGADAIPRLIFERVRPKHKVIEINRVVEIHSKEEKLRRKSKANQIVPIGGPSPLKVESLPHVEQLGEISVVKYVHLVDGSDIKVEGHSTVTDYTPTESIIQKSSMPVRNSLPEDREPIDDILNQNDQYSPETSVIIRVSTSQESPPNVIQKRQGKALVPEVIREAVETSTISLEGLFENARKAKVSNTIDGTQAHIHINSQNNDAKIAVDSISTDYPEASDDKNINISSNVPLIAWLNGSNGERQEIAILKNSPIPLKNNDTEQKSTLSSQFIQEDATTIGSNLGNFKVSTVPTTLFPTYVRPIVPLLRPESNESSPLVISIANLDKVILSKVKKTDSPALLTNNLHSSIVNPSLLSKTPQNVRLSNSFATKNNNNTLDSPISDDSRGASSNRLVSYIKPSINPAKHPNLTEKKSKPDTPTEMYTIFEGSSVGSTTTSSLGNKIIAKVITPCTTLDRYLSKLYKLHKRN